LFKYVVYDNRGRVEDFVDADNDAAAYDEAIDKGCCHGFTLAKLEPMNGASRATITTAGKDFVECDAVGVAGAIFDIDEDSDIEEGEYRIFVEGFGANGVIHTGRILKFEKWVEQDIWDEARELLAMEWPNVLFVIEEDTRNGQKQITGDVQMPIARDPFRIRIDLDPKKGSNGEPIYRARLYMKVLVKGEIKKSDVYNTSMKSPATAAEGLCAIIRAVVAFVNTAE